jgi:hypothetical protein
MRVVDVAAGKGYLQGALRQRGFRDVESWDKRPRLAKVRANMKGRYGYFNSQTAPAYDAVVAMHPDEATDHAIVYAGTHRVPAIICPCCVKPSAVPYSGRCHSDSYGDWMRHLVKLASKYRLSVTHAALRMTGRNQVLIFRPETP